MRTQLVTRVFSGDTAAEATQALDAWLFAGDGLDTWNQPVMRNFDGHPVFLEVTHDDRGPGRYTIHLTVLLGLKE